jgi:predicted dehydrogenase
VQGGQLVKTSPEVGAAIFSPGKLPLSAMDAAAADEAGAWLDAIINDTDPMVTAEQAAVVTEILDAMYVSGRTGKPVYFNGASED